ncbi:MAG: AAA family ATPase [Pirellulales bacterium]
MQFQVASENNPDGTQITQEFFKNLEDSVLKAESYRGKILSLEQTEHSYSGESAGIKVHKLRTVEREQVILPSRTLELLDRNLIGFVRQRPALARYRQATRKGLLFYGPPGTGKTHTIHYLAKALEGHTTLLITAEQVALLGEYMTLARNGSGRIELEDINCALEEMLFSGGSLNLKLLGAEGLDERQEERVEA